MLEPVPPVDFLALDSRSGHRGDGVAVSCETSSADSPFSNTTGSSVAMVSAEATVAEPQKTPATTNITPMPTSGSLTRATWTRSTSLFEN